MRLVARLADVARASELLGKPAVVFDTGFSTTALAWRHPRLGMGETDPEMQALLYGLYGAALAQIHRRSGEPHGLYVRGWSSDPGGDGSRDRGFDPRGKPAEEAIGELFRSP